MPLHSGKEHEFQLDFPKLMTRSQAIRTKERGVKINDVFLSQTDFVGRIGSVFAPILNYFNKVSFVRSIMQTIIGIHSKRTLPEFHGNTFKNGLPAEILSLIIQSTKSLFLVHVLQMFMILSLEKQL